MKDKLYLTELFDLFLLTVLQHRVNVHRVEYWAWLTDNTVRTEASVMRQAKQSTTPPTTQSQITISNKHEVPETQSSTDLDVFQEIWNTQRHLYSTYI